MLKEKISKEHSSLIEEIGIVIEERAGLPPLAARIYATLILASDDGFTFEDISEIHQASKSAVSNSLSVLVKLEYIEYFTKPGERKRYIKASKFYVKTAIEKYSQLFEKEVKVVRKINEFNKKHNPEKFKNEQSAAILYQEYLTRLSEGFRRKMDEIEGL
ncbi:ArsR family transcriptional regulator [Aequorivita todarodis]|uniref:GbsR/MarR family transcriptional regulator n=1 Tax=Aequorivita todarodis TaxID=2036821 RepID=UPI002350D9D7|nr:ArsR family transcriptional regulator [Aequorivita todarodis]MDC8001176.1 ArsR family transcriptional regulator [Aequorivita todarodis]